MRKSNKLLSSVFIVVFILALCSICGISVIKNSVLDSTYVFNQEINEVSNQNLGENENLKSLDTTSFQGGKYVHIGGNPIGIVINAGGLIVVSSGEVATSNGNVNPLAEIDIKKGDIIFEIDGKPCDSLYVFKKTIENSKGNVEIALKRGTEILKRKVTPVMDAISGAKRIGLIAKEDIGGVGTLTFTTDNLMFAGLGHHIYDGETGLCDELQSGNLYNVEISDVVKGERGKAGGLQASVNRLSQSIGEIKGNTSIGLYGTVNRKSSGDVYRIAEFGEAKMGHAQILTTINGTSPKFYDIDIVKVVSQNEVGEKGMVIAVRDKELLDKAGGIVQGMSGSPIVQNGLLIGAVTHVFISDPTRGYAVHSRFMFDKAEQVCSTLHIEKTFKIQ